jgi:predicted transcriptional regulator
MVQQNDIRWHQRLQNFHDAFCELDEAVCLSNERDLAKHLGVSLGGVNYCVKALIDIGWIKAGNCSR